MGISDFERRFEAGLDTFTDIEIVGDTDGIRDCCSVGRPDNKNLSGISDTRMVAFSVGSCDGFPVNKLFDGLYDGLLDKTGDGLIDKKTSDGCLDSKKFVPDADGTFEANSLGRAD